MPNASLVLALCVVLIYAYVILGTVTVCWFHSDDLVSGKFICDKDGRIEAMMEQLLAFVGGFLTGKLTGKI